jgi:transposase
MTVVFVGVDIAKANFAAATCTDETSQALGGFDNTLAGFEALAERLRGAGQPCGSIIQLIIEPTGGYELPLARFALEHGWQVTMPNPRHVRDWAKSQGRRAKTDAQDALLLARYGADQPIRLWHPLPAAVSELESLLQRRADVEQLIGQERNRQHALSRRPDKVAARG